MREAPFGANRVSLSDSTKSKTEAVRRRLTDLSRAMKKIRTRLDSDLYFDMSEATSVDEIMAANLLRDCTFDEALRLAYLLNLRV